MQALRRIFTFSLTIHHKPTAHALGRAAQFSASSLAQTAIPDNASLALLSAQLQRDFDYYFEHTRDPIFQILLSYGINEPPTANLAAARVPLQEYASWARSLREESFTDIAHRVGQAGQILFLATAQTEYS